MKKKTTIHTGTGNLKVSSPGFPTLMQNRYGSIFLVNFIKNEYWLVCISPDIGDHAFGEIEKTNKKGLEELTEIEEGFFIKLKRRNA